MDKKRAKNRCGSACLNFWVYKSLCDKKILHRRLKGRALSRFETYFAPARIVSVSEEWRKFIFGRQQLLVGYYELEQYPERLERELEQRQHEQQYQD